MTEHGTAGGHAVVLTQRVSDLDRWKAAWDAKEAERLAAGALGHLLLRARDEPGVVTVLLGVGDRATAEAIVVQLRHAAEGRIPAATSTLEVRPVELLRDDLVGDRQLPCATRHVVVGDLVRWLDEDDAAAGARRIAAIVGHAVARGLTRPDHVLVIDQADRLDALPTDGRAHTSGWAKTYRPTRHTTTRTSSAGSEPTMYVIATHDVDDVQHWFDSPKRAEFFEARGMKATAFRDPSGESNAVAVLIETPDMASLQDALATPEAAATEKEDGVHVDTLKIYVA